MDGNQSQVSECPIVCREVFVRASVAQTFSSVSLTLNWSVRTSCDKTHSSSHTSQHAERGGEAREIPELGKELIFVPFVCQRVTDHREEAAFLKRRAWEPAAKPQHLRIRVCQILHRKQGKNEFYLFILHRMAEQRLLRVMWGS